MIECDFSFWVLFIAAYSRKPTLKEKAKFSRLSQSEKNLFVQKWAKKAQWATEERLGSDDQIYLAFFPLK